MRESTISVLNSRVSRDEFREAMSCLGAAVNVVTTSGSSGETGFTATAVCSVSDQPATILVCVNQNAQSSSLLIRNGVLCVNTLHAGQQELASFFATKLQNKAQAFLSPQWTTLVTGAPALSTAIVALDSRVSEYSRVGTHYVIFAEVEAVHFGPKNASLMYHDRAYKHL